MTRETDEWDARFHDMPEVPFPEELRFRILAHVDLIDGSSKAEGDTHFVSAAMKSRRVVQSRWQPWLAAVSGLCILVCMVFGISAWNQTPSRLQRQALPLGVTESSSASYNNRREVVFGLSNAPISVSNTRIGSEPGYANGSFVLANLTNLGTKPIQEGQIFGVLWLSKQPQSHSVARSEWAAFVNFEMADGRKQLAPGESAVWSFRPVGAPTNNGHLTDTPHLVFYKSGLVTPTQADVVWPQSQLAVSQVVMTQRKHWVGGQSVQVSANLVNHTKHSVSISSLLGIVWFSPVPISDWTSPKVVRFLGVPSIRGNQTVVRPNSSVSIYFRLIGSDKTDFLGMIPHVAVIQKG